MGFDAAGKLTRAQEYLARKWEEGKALREGQEAYEAVREKNALLGLVGRKLAGASADEMPPLAFDSGSGSGSAAADAPRRRAVFLVTMPISFGPFELTKQSYQLLARRVGMSLSSVSHWALCVVDRGPGPCWCYDLMSDQLAPGMLGKNVFRHYRLTVELVATWNSCYYVGETTRSHEEIVALGYGHIAAHPRYNLLSSNCQTLVEDLVKELCNGQVISEAKLSEELHKASPRIARDLMVAKLKSTLERREGKNKQKEVDEDVNIIKKLEGMMKKREDR
ncbi:hypothetical protein F4780DRAFT_782371 [Xylariomycetidae sp. FL0641]|nr:hypothetical protein F4780DRAFT_782371 [Xylariomycetidae sp. FL0641]